MISFAPTDDQEAMRATVRAFACEVLRPAARDADETGCVPEALLLQAAGLGIVQAQVPEEYGGAGDARSPLTAALILEALAYGDPGLALAIAHSAAFAWTLVDSGSAEQKARLLPAFCGARRQTGSCALMEPAPLFDPQQLTTSAAPSGSGYVLSGSKCCVPLADRASHLLVLARVRPSGEIAAFIVARDAPGLMVTAEKNLGLCALATSRVQLERVEGERLGGTFDYARWLARSRTAGAALLVGLACAVMDYAIPYAKERRAFGQFIAQKQAVAFMLSNMRVETDAMRWLTWLAASKLESGADATASARAAQRYAAEHALKIADDGVQVLGGHGFIREHPMELWYRAACTLSILDGVAYV